MPTKTKLVTKVEDLSQSFAPRFYVAFDGNADKGLTADIIEFEYISRSEKADELVITINNKNLKRQDDPRFVTGTAITARWGYPNQVSFTKDLIISDVGLKFPSGVPTIVIRAQDERLEMNKTGTAQSWGPVASSDIAAQIANQYGYRVEIADSGDARKESRLQPSDVTDAQYLTLLARDLNWDFYIENGVLHFHEKRMSRAPDFSYTYYASRRTGLLDFEINLNLKQKPNTGAAGASPTTGEVAASEADAKNISDARNGSFAIIPTQKSGEYLYTPSAESDASVVEKHAEARQSNIESGIITARATLAGNPRLDSRSNILINGIGKTYSGAWRVVEARHMVRPATQIYVTKCTLSKNAVGAGDKDAQVNEGASQAAGEGRRLSIVTERKSGEYSP